MFATDVNSLFVTDSFLGYATAVKARVVLKKPHPVFGFVNGKAAYGIRRVRSCRLCQMYITVGGGVSSAFVLIKSQKKRPAWN